MVKQYYPEHYAKLHPDEAQAEQESKVFVEKLPTSSLKKKAKELKVPYFNAMDRDELLLALELHAEKKEDELKKLVDDVKKRYMAKRGDYFKGLKKNKK